MNYQNGTGAYETYTATNDTYNTEAIALIVQKCYCFETAFCSNYSKRTTSVITIIKHMQLFGL